MTKKKVNRPKKVTSYSFNAVLPWAICGVVILFAIVFTGVRLQVNSSNANALPQNSLEMMVQLEVPSRPIAQGEQLKTIPFTKVQWPNSPEVARFMKFASEYREHYAKTALLAFSPVPISSLANSAKDANAVVEGIPSGYRAITVKVDVESAVEGWAQAGNYVDVIVMRQSSDPELGIEAKVIAENVKILSAGASVESATGSSKNAMTPPTVTLLVSQEDALKVRTAVNIGKLTFALRGLGDESPTLAVNMNQKTLLGGARSLQVSKREGFKGSARGPDGHLYVLDEEARWVKSISEDKSAD